MDLPLNQRFELTLGTGKFGAQGFRGSIISTFYGTSGSPPQPFLGGTISPEPCNRDTTSSVPSKHRWTHMGTTCYIPRKPGHLYPLERGAP